MPGILEEVQDQLRSMLGERNILVLIDDLWQAEDMYPYQIGSTWQYLITTRLPIVAHTLCDVVYHSRQLTACQALHVLSHDLPGKLVREHRQILQALCHQDENPADENCTPRPDVLLKRQADLPPRIASQSHFKSSVASSPLPEAPG